MPECWQHRFNCLKHESKGAKQEMARSEAACLQEKKTSNPFENVSDAIEDVTQKVFGKKIYAEFDELHEIELEKFILI
jgi:hypothetical protein